ncbi:MAG: hypothetical protein KC493_06530 [Bacteriovoracaceae bacterium]|nr:hypothetical protein [Bacteriovoracaceae bacterium]
MQITFALIIFSFCFSLYAQDSDYSGQGEVALEFRQFEKDQSELTEDTNISIFTRLEQRYESDPFSHVFRGYARVDKKDQNRAFVALEDAYFSTFLATEYKVSAGYRLFNWTATEAFHPADVINSRNFDSNLENLEKKGEITLEFEAPFFDGVFSFYYFPRFEEPEYPGEKSRISSVVLQRSVVVDGVDTTTNDYWSPQYGFRVTQSLFDADVSFHFLNHIDRNMPIVGTHKYSTVLVPGSVTPLTTESTPYFFRVQQIGGTYQQVFGDLILKFEFANRSFEQETPILTTKSVVLGGGSGATKIVENHTEAAFGMEYIISLEGGVDLNLFAEGNGIFGVDEVERVDMSTFQRDVMLGFRVAFNDLMGKEIYLTAIGDIERETEYLINFNYTQRLSDNWKIKTGVRIIEAPQKNPAIKEGLESLDGDSYLFMNLSRFF